MAPLDLVKLPALMERTSGSAELKIGLIDGPVVTQHPDLAGDHLREIRGNSGRACIQDNSARQESSCDCSSPADARDLKKSQAWSRLEIPIARTHRATITERALTSEMLDRVMSDVGFRLSCTANVAACRMAAGCNQINGPISSFLQSAVPPAN